ncbi:MAG: T9SS type A sorting domain-containing protein [Bacteroidetes bacterium]|nr:T9SS type A sorting domain-containing protein [Bacteroidota bacterium]
MKIIPVILFVLFSAHIRAQSLTPTVVSSTGNFKVTGGYSLSSTVGEPITTTVTSANYILTQGFQQQSLKGVSVQEIQTENLNINVFPNPAAEEVHVLILSPRASNTQVKMFDIIGREIIVPTTIINEGTQKQFTLNLNSLSASMYFISVYDQINRTTQTIKIQKVTL